jgi:hypothetical protein
MRPPKALEQSRECTIVNCRQFPPFQRAEQAREPYWVCVCVFVFLRVFCMRVCVVVCVCVYMCVLCVCVYICVYK